MLLGVTLYGSLYVHGIGEKMSLFILEGNVNMVCKQHIKYIVGNVSIGEYSYSIL